MKSKAGTKAELRAACCPWAAEAAARGSCSDSFSAVKIYVFTVWFSASEGDGLRVHPVGASGQVSTCRCANHRRAAGMPPARVLQRAPRLAGEACGPGGTLLSKVDVLLVDIIPSLLKGIYPRCLLSSSSLLWSFPSAPPPWHLPFQPGFGFAPNGSGKTG